MKKIVFLATICLPLIFCSCSKEIIDTDISIYGTVVDFDTYEPLQGALVTLIPSSKNRHTGYDGSFQFDGLKAQQYKIQAQKDGYGYNHVSVTLNEGEREDIVITLKKIK